MENLLKGLNSDQRQAVLHNHESDNQLLILAGAGSGKTSVLTKRIQYRILSGVNPAGILALTFTAAAAEEMRERVKKLFPETEVRLCTFHSLALSLLREKYNGTFGYKILGFSQTPMPKECLNRDFMEDLVAAGVTPNCFSREELFSDRMPEHLKRKTEACRRRVLQSGEVVFEDLIYLSIQLLEKHLDIQQIVQYRFQEILVDEYQDINPSQYRLVRAILGNRKNLFAVGDDDQAIYGFRGADVGNILRFKKDFPQCTVIRLEWNYRSVPQVLYLANRIFVNKPPLLRKVLRAGNLRQDALFAENRKPEIWISNDPIFEIERLVSKIKEMHLDYKLPYRSFAILVRYNRQRQYYGHALKEYGIPTSFTENDDETTENAEITDDVVQIVTVHGSKGLQYPVVFYAGLAEGLTPGELSGNKKQRQMQLAEEYRLFYVGVTRAESYLVLLYCKERFWKGRRQCFRKSRFLKCVEISPKESKLPVFIFKIRAAIYALSYMLYAIVAISFRRLFHLETAAWLEERVQRFARLCMKGMGVDLTIEKQPNLSKIDWSRPILVISNHQSYLDIPVVFLALGRSIGFLAKHELTRIPFLNYWMKQLGCVFVHRKEKGGGLAAQQELLKTRIPRIVVFPEGTRSKNGELQSFKSGGFRLAAEWKATIIPLKITGSRAAWENRQDSKRKKVSVEILEPLDLRQVEEEQGKIGLHDYVMPEIRRRME